MLKHTTRILIAGGLGNFIEAFDMSLCGLLSVYIASSLIDSSVKSLLFIFSTFFLGYLSRPLGAITLGLYSDKCGRNLILAISITGMGLSTTLIGLIPSYQLIGDNAMIILLLLRIIQSFSCGAEYLNSSAYLVENAPMSHKGYIGSWAAFGSMAGLLLAELTSLLVSYATELNPLNQHIYWRLPFILALVGSSIGLYVRLRIPKSMEYIVYYANKSKPTLKQLLLQSLTHINQNKKDCFYAILVSSLGVTTTFQFYIYALTQKHLSGTVTDHQLILSTIFSLVVLLAFFPLFGKLSDKISRETLVIVSSLSFLCLSPIFFYLLSYGSFTELLLVQAIIAIPASAYYAVVPVMLAEMFPLTLRCTVLSLLYSIAASLSAGLSPLLSLLLMHHLLHAMAPSVLTFILVLLVLGITFWKKHKSTQSSYAQSSAF